MVYVYIHRIYIYTDRERERERDRERFILGSSHILFLNYYGQAENTISAHVSDI